MYAPEVIRSNLDEARKILTSTQKVIDRAIADARKEMRAEFAEQLADARRKSFESGKKAGQRAAKEEVMRREAKAAEVERDLAKREREIRLRSAELDAREKRIEGEELKSEKTKKTRDGSTAYAAGFAEGAKLASQMGKGHAQTR